MNKLLIIIGSSLLIITFAYLRFSKNKDMFPNKYKSEMYGFEIQYPDNWYAREFDRKIDLRDEDFIRNLELRRNDSGDGRVAVITIGEATGYNGSSSICANEQCEFDTDTIFISERLNASVTSVQDSHRFQIALNEVMVWGYPLYISGVYEFEEDKKEIIRILQTLKTKEIKLDRQQ